VRIQRQGTDDQCSLVLSLSVNPENIIAVDSKGILHRDREDRERLQEKFKEKWHICETTNIRGVRGDVPQAMEGSDVVISASKPGPGVIKQEWGLEGWYITRGYYDNKNHRYCHC